MSKQTIILCFVAALSWSVVSAQYYLVPPSGFSVGFTGKTAAGTQKYVCHSGSWIISGSSANIYAPDGTKLGNYWSVYNQKTHEITYFWNIINSGGDGLESGSTMSRLKASQLKSLKVSATSVSEYLAIVTKHLSPGSADQVSFVSLTATTGGLAPKKALCTSNGATAGVPFSGTFIFYDQDLEPPQNIPASIAPKGTFVQVVFVEGTMRYKFTAGKWQYEGFFATIFDVAGGNILGKVGNVAKPNSDGSNLLWKFNNPNGFWLSGYQCAQPVQMAADDCPWRLMKITSSGGTQTAFGPFKYALMAGTMGGQMPKLAAKTDGMEWGACFRGLFYFYSD